MKLSDLLGFLIPDFSEPVQAVFFVLIFGLAGFSLWLARKNAVEDTWKKNWENNTPERVDDDLDSEHGSIHDLSEAVASKSEKLVEILPGILLIIGLLGTFIGLGVSLNKAAAALAGAADLDQMSSAMQKLTEMLQGLGVKFKASTWGILGFLVMKVLSSYFGFEDRRLRWCIRRVKSQLDERRDVEGRRRKEEGVALIGAIEKMGVGLCQAFETHLVSNTNAMTKVFSDLAERLQDFSAENKRGHADVKAVIEKSMKENKENLGAMKDSAVQMGEAVKGLSAASEKLQVVIERMDEGISSSLDKIKSDLGGVVSDMSENIGKATESIGSAVNGFSTNIGETMTDVRTLMKSSDDRQANIQIAVNSAMADLGGVAGALTGNIEKMGKEIGSGLGAISKGNERVASLMGGFEDVAANIKDASEKNASGFNELIAVLKGMAGGFGLFRSKSKEKQRGLPAPSSTP